MEDASTSSADLLVERELETKYGFWHEYLFRYAETDIVVLAFGDWQGKPDLLVRVHSACLAAHYLSSVECDCREQLEMAFERIVTNGRGMIVLLDQDGRGNGHAALMRAAVYARLHECNQSTAYQSLGYPGDSRSFDGVGVVLRKLGVVSVRLMTNNPEKAAVLREQGIDVTHERIVMEEKQAARLQKYYRYKAQEGHLIRIETKKE